MMTSIIQKYSSLTLLFLAFIALQKPDLVAEALGCMHTICSNNARNFQNEIRPCTKDGICGEYKSRRRNNVFLEAVELSCNEGTYVYAPFDGEITYHRPFGGARKAQCADQGVRIDGSGQWRGYYALISTVKLYRYGGRVKAGEKLGVVGNIECFEDRSAPTSALVAAFSSSRHAPKNYVRVELFREGRPIDPTHHLVDCMCTGQICETNRINSLIGAPFKHDRYNGVRGWELSCPLATGPLDANGDASEDDAALWDDDDTESQRSRAPKIFSPIEGCVIGRVRLNFAGGTYTGCDNEGLFIVGTNKWADYEVRLYNVRFLDELGVGVKHVDQGQFIGTRLTCASASDSVFLEVRFQGVLVDISDAISAKNCQHRHFSTLFRRRRAWPTTCELPRI